MTEESLAPAPAEQSPIVEAPAQDAPQTQDDAPPVAKEQDSAPPKVETSKTARDAIAKAFADVDGKDDKSAAPKADDGQPARGPDGKFIAKDAAKDGQEAPEAQQPPEQAKTPLAEPPARFSADAKAAWKDAPEAVRAEAHRAIREMEAGLQQKDEMLRPLQPFFDLAKQQGVTLAPVLDRYVNMERLLAQNPVVGLRTLAQNMGWTPQQMAGLVLHASGQKDGQPADPRDTQIAMLQRRIDQLEGNVGQVTQTVTQSREQAVMQQIEQFATSHPRFGELENEIARLLETGYAQTLEDAYSIAERLNPAPQPAPQPALPTPPAQTRVARSVTGAPTSGSNPGNRQPSKTRGESLARAFAQAGIA